MAVKLCGDCPVEVCNNPRMGCQTQEISFAGAVLGRRERNGAHDSDFYAVVWDADRGEVREVWYGTTSSWTYHNSAQVDATPEVIARAVEWYRTRWLAVMTERERQEARAVRVGRVVRSLTRRGKNVGMTGEVVRIEDNRYRKGAKRLRLRVDGEDTPRYLDADRVEVVDPREPDLAELAQHAATLSAPPSWGSVVESFTTERA